MIDFTDGHVWGRKWLGQSVHDALWYWILFCKIVTIWYRSYWTESNMSFMLPCGCTPQLQMSLLLFILSCATLHQLYAYTWKIDPLRAILHCQVLYSIISCYKVDNRVLFLNNICMIRSWLDLLFVSMYKEQRQSMLTLTLL